LAIDYFYSLTPRQFDNILTGFERKERTIWERERLGWYYTVVAQHGSDKIKLNSFHPFSWDKETAVSIENRKPKTLEEMSSFWDNVDKNKQQ
jgi:hypothetical protein